MSVSRPDRLSDVDEAAATVSEVEGEIREFVRRDISVFRRQRPADGSDAAADNINALIQRVSAQSVGEIERVMGELGQVRDMLRSEGDRVQREIAGYAALSQAAMTSMKIIADSLTQWRPSTAEVRRG